MMNYEETLHHLAIASQFLTHSRYAGTARQAVADGFSAIDAAFSALLVSAGVDRSYKHQKKLNQVRDKFPKLLDEHVRSSEFGATVFRGVAWDEVQAFYEEWLQARYEVFEISAGQARDRVMQAGRVIDLAIEAVAKEQGKTTEEVKGAVDARAFGSTDCRLYEALSDAHDHVFAEAERYGEEHGNKLAIKMGAATNFADIDLVASDTLTREIIRNDEAIATECSRLHVRLCNLMEKLRYQRYEALVKQGHSAKEARDQATEFMFALRFKYHGEKQSVHGERLGKAIAAVLGGIEVKASADGEKSTEK